MSTTHLLLVFAVMFLTAVFGIAQHRYYGRTVARVMREHNQPGRVLVSGRGKGRLRGAIAILVLSKPDDVIHAALVMEGATVLARFKERTDWVGLSARDELPQCSPRAAKAVADARAHMPGRRRPAPAPGTGFRGAPTPTRSSP